MRNFTVGLILLLAVPAVERPAVEHVNPFVGTDDMGHTYPGATAPFGLVQLSPQTDLVPYSLGEGYNPETYR
jgi:putative alpha-1,2-mannosidase